MAFLTSKRITLEEAIVIAGGCSNLPQYGFRDFGAIRLYGVKHKNGWDFRYEQTSEDPIGIILTDAQVEAIERIRPRWTRIGEPQMTIGCDGAVAVQCFYQTGASIWVCIEKDGYAHS